MKTHSILSASLIVGSLLSPALASADCVVHKTMLVRKLVVKPDRDPGPTPAGVELPPPRGLEFWRVITSFGLQGEESQSCKHSGEIVYPLEKEPAREERFLRLECGKYIVFHYGNKNEVRYRLKDSARANSPEGAPSCETSSAGTTGSESGVSRSDGTR